MHVWRVNDQQTRACNRSVCALFFSIT